MRNHKRQADIKEEKLEEKRKTDIKKTWTEEKEEEWKSVDNRKKTKNYSNKLYKREREIERKNENVFICWPG